MKKRVLFSIILTGILFISPFFALGAEVFNPNQLIEDVRFSDTETLGGPEGIQKFLESRGSVLANTDPSFLVKLREPESSLKSRLPDPRPDLGRQRTAAELIYDSAVYNGLNPQVILVTLQKEQSLITKNFTSDTDLQRALDRALGFGCPDGGFCGDVFLGFYHQLFGNFDSEDNRYIGMPASLMRSFNYEVGGVRVGRGPGVDVNNNAFGSSARVRTSRVGDTVTFENTTGFPNYAPETQTVTLSNFATAALYRYTPHVYNGNYNFWRFFNEWFRYPNGTLVQNSGAGQVYVVDNGQLRLVSDFVINQRNFDRGNIVTLSATEFSSFSLGLVMPPLDGTLITTSSGVSYLIENGERKLLSSFVAEQRGFDLSTANLLPESEVSTYPDGGVALPEEGTLVKSSDNPAVYLITNNQKRPLTLFVFNQRGFKFSNVLTAGPGELDSYPTGQILTPLDGTLVKGQSSPAVYHVSNGLLQPLTLFVFNQRGFKFSNVKVVSEQEINSWTVTSIMPPETGVLAKGKSSPVVYYFEAGIRRPISYDVFVARGFSFADVLTVDDIELALFEEGNHLSLPDRVLVMVSGDPTVYWLVDEVMRPLTFNAFQNRQFSFSDIVEISAEELSKYPLGAVVEN